MPTYEYRCKACGDELEVVQSFTDDALTTCDACGGDLRKVFGNVGIAFKGSGFYKNDSRGKTKAASSTSSGDNGSSGSDTASPSTTTGDKAASTNGSSSGGSTETKKAKPAATPASGT